MFRSTFGFGLHGIGPEFAAPVEPRKQLAQICRGRHGSGDLESAGSPRRLSTRFDFSFFLFGGFSFGALLGGFGSDSKLRRLRVGL